MPKKNTLSLASRKRSLYDPYNQALLKEAFLQGVKLTLHVRPQLLAPLFGRSVTE